jgi:uncharacterized protein with HEPN domain
MQPEKRDAAYMWDMLQAARDASAAASGLTAQQLQRDRMRMLALERSMELIGEAARRVSRHFREKHPQIPWKEIIGLRNILAHEYGRVDHAQLHATAARDVPTLIAALETLLPPDE